MIKNFTRNFRTVFLCFLFLILFITGANAAQELQLKEGFNFISFKEAISIKPSEFKALNPAIEDVFLYSQAAGSFLSVNEGSLTSLAAGKGYIVKNSSSAKITVSVPGGALSSIGNVSLKSGFNLVGFSKAPPSPAVSFSQLMNTYSFIHGLYKWNATANSFFSVVRDSGGTPVQIDGVDPLISAGEAYFFNLTEDTLINYDGPSTILMGKTIEPPVSTNPYAGRYAGTFTGVSGPPYGNITLIVSTAGALEGEGYNNANTPPTAISPAGNVSMNGDAVFYVTFNNSHKFDGAFTSNGASGHFYELDGVTLKGTWSVTDVHAPQQKVATPVINPAGGVFSSTVSAEITCATEGAVVKYTIDGASPSSTTGYTYSSPITVSSTGVIKAMAYKADMTDSEIASASFTIEAQPSGAASFLRKFGSKGTADGQFTSGPINVAVENSTGYVFVSDTYAHRILKFDYQGNFVSSFGSAGSGNGQFMYPTGIAVTGGGEMFITDYGNRRVQKFTTSGVFLTSFGTAGTGDGQFQAPDCVAVDKYGNVYVTDFSNNNVQRFSSEGSFNQKWGGRGSGDGQFGENSPKDIAVDTSGNIYVADIGNSRIQKFNSYGSYLMQWGSSGTSDGRFSSPHGVCADSDGHIFVSDKSCRIQKFSPMGDFISSWGSQGALDGQFNDPSGICSDSNGNIYVADFGNSRVQVFGPGSAPVVEKVAAPVFSPASGTYLAAQNVTITCATDGAVIYYTNDGSTPSASNGNVYSSAINVSASITIKAIAVKAAMTDSDVVTSAYTIVTPEPAKNLSIDIGDGVILEMVKISAAGKSFYMGSPSSEQDRESDEGPVHKVTFTRDFYIGKYEITEAQWKKIYGRWPIISISNGDNYPAYYISWDHICGSGGFLEKLNAAAPGGYNSFRLPTEAEWEYAARGGTQSRYYWGDDLSGSEIGTYAQYASNSNRSPAPVGSKTANAFGLFDMSGNVSEWCYDMYGSYSAQDEIDPMGPNPGTSNRVFRGGSLEDDAKLCRAANRFYMNSGNSTDDLGFRVAMCINEAAQ